MHAWGGALLALLLVVQSAAVTYNIACVLPLHTLNNELDPAAVQVQLGMFDIVVCSQNPEFQNRYASHLAISSSTKMSSPFFYYLRARIREVDFAKLTCAAG
jgi:hypothetical protein